MKQDGENQAWQENSTQLLIEWKELEGVGAQVVEIK